MRPDADRHAAMAHGQGKSEAVRLADVLHGVGREIAELERLASDVQVVVSRLARSAGTGSQTIEKLQALDLLTQRLSGIAGFLQTIAATLPSDWLSDAAAAARVVPLSELARRLALEVSGSPLEEPCVAETDMEFFGTPTFR